MSCNINGKGSLGGSRAAIGEKVAGEGQGGDCRMSLLMRMHGNAAPGLGF